MKNLIIIASLLLSLPIMAQTKVVKKNAVKANNFGITYSLPKTSLVVDAEVTKVTCKAGPYYKYAEKYLGVKDAITEDKVYYELGKISLVNKGVPDADNTFIVEFKAGTVAPYAYLTEDGLLCSINAEYTPDESALEAARKMSYGNLYPIKEMFPVFRKFACFPFQALIFSLHIVVFRLHPFLLV